MKIKSVLFPMILITLTGCANYHNNNNLFNTNEKSFMKAKAIPAVKMPVGLNDAGMEDIYAIPDVSGAASGSANLLPPGSLVAQQAGR